MSFRHYLQRLRHSLCGGRRPRRAERSRRRLEVEPLEARGVRSTEPLAPGSETIPALHSNVGARHSIWLDFDGLDSEEADNWGWTGPVDVTTDTVAILQSVSLLSGGIFGA